MSFFYLQFCLGKIALFYFSRLPDIRKSQTWESYKRADSCQCTYTVNLIFLGSFSPSVCNTQMVCVCAQGIWGILDVSDLLHKCRSIECSTSLVTVMFTKQLRPDAWVCLRAKARAVLCRNVETQLGPFEAGACDRKQEKGKRFRLYKDWKKEQESDTWFSTEHKGSKGIWGKNQYPWILSLNKSVDSNQARIYLITKKNFKPLTY